MDTAIQQLQREYYITVDGNERKISAKGEFYGWPVNRYRRVADWAPAGWLDGARDWSMEEAREFILGDGVSISTGTDRHELAKKLGWRQNTAHPSPNHARSQATPEAAQVWS